MAHCWMRKERVLVSRRRPLWVKLSSDWRAFVKLPWEQSLKMDSIIQLIRLWVGGGDLRENGGIAEGRHVVRLVDCCYLHDDFIYSVCPIWKWLVAPAMFADRDKEVVWYGQRRLLRRRRW